MRESILSSQVGLALKLARLSPLALDTDMFQIVHEGENYTVHTDRLPTVYIEKEVPSYFFEYKGKDWIIFFAMNRVNSRRTPVVVTWFGSSDTFTFRYCMQPESAEDFTDGLESCFTQIEEALNAFGMACELAVREEEEAFVTRVMTNLSNHLGEIN